MQFPKWNQHTHCCPKNIWARLTRSNVICFSPDFRFPSGKHRKTNIFSRLFIYAEIWGSASVSSPPFPKHCLLAVWRLGSAEFPPEISDFVKEKGTSPTFVELSQPRRPLKPTCSLQVSCSSTDSSQTCLADEIWQHHSLSWPNLFSLWDLTGSQLEVPQEIWWDHSLRLSYRNTIYTLIQSLHKS